MRRKSFLLIIFMLSTSVLFGAEKSMQRIIKESMKVVEMQSMAMAAKLKSRKDQLPRSAQGRNALVTSDAHWWTSGFFPGQLWYLYEYRKSKKIKEWADLYTIRLENEKFTTDNHDVGFILCSSFGNGYRLTHNPRYEEALVTGALSLATRFRPLCGCIQSWNLSDSMKMKGWQVPVIIDNMMNLELLLWASKQTNDLSFYHIATSHANATLKNHFRPDYSTYHVVSYDSLTGNVSKKCTLQGYSDESSWARGQAWGLYGFVNMYARTGLKRYLEQAKKIAAYILFHPNLPDDKIPYWDFNAPNIPKEPRDASSAAIIASALIELSHFVDEPLRGQYIGVAELQLRNLSSPEYLAKPGTNSNFILKHSVGFMAKDQEVDAALAYADYYYVEALVRFHQLLKKK